jgi:hypothetical protein
MQVNHLNRFDAIALCGLPIIIFITGIILSVPMYPIYINSGFGFGPDAAYVYLFAALDILRGHSPVFTDHPGTPLQILMAAIIPVTWCLNYVIGLTDAGLIDSVLRNPELYLRTTSYVLLLLTSLASLYLGSQFYRASNRLVLSIATQTAPLAFPLVSPMMVYPTAESLLQILSIVLLGVLTPFFVKTQFSLEPTAHRRAIYAGILCGVGLATKLSFLPVLTLLLILTRARLVLIAIGTCVVAWFVGVLPIWQRLPTMLGWFKNILTHSGLHGHGSASVFDLGLLIQNIKILSGMFVLFYIVVFSIAAYCAFCLVRRYRFRTDLTRQELKSTMVILLVLLAQTVAVAKHPGPSYMVGALPVAIFAAAYLLSCPTFRIESSHILLLKPLQFCLIALLCAFAIFNGTQAFSTIHYLRERAAQSSNEVKAAISRFDNPIVIGTFNCNFKDCATWFGIALARGLDTRMERVSPNFYYYDIFSGRLRLPGQTEVSQEDSRQILEGFLQSGRSVLLISLPYPHIEVFKRDLIQQTSGQNLYKITGYVRARP